MENAKPQRVFVTGASGFVGSAVIGELLSRGHHITALVHRGKLKAEGRVKTVHGDLFSADALHEGLPGNDAVIHLVGIIKENPAAGITFDRIHHQGAKNIVDAAKAAGVKRFILMSAAGVRSEAASAYHRSKFLAEQHLRASGLEWTIFQPSLIHGPDGEFLKMEAAWARGKAPPFLFMPYFGGGLLGRSHPTRVQPVYVNDVARAFADALDRPISIAQTYPLGGGDTLTWPQMHHIAAKVFTGKRKPAIAIPAWYGSMVTHIVPSAFSLPFTRDQVIMAQEDSVCDMKKFADDFGWHTGGFEQTLGSYAAKV